MPLLEWDELERVCKGCSACGLCKTRTNVVFGAGDRASRIMFIGEGPGEQEDLKGEPFVGRAGRLLDDMLGFIGLNRDKIYIANMVKCRPPQNRDPSDDEKDACSGYLKNQIELIRPKIIVCLGRIAAMRIIDPKLKISVDHGKWYERDGVKMTALFHPAALLRDPRRKGDTLDDLRGIEQVLSEL